MEITPDRNEVSRRQVAEALSFLSATGREVEIVVRKGNWDYVQLSGPSGTTILQRLGITTDEDGNVDSRAVFTIRAIVRACTDQEGFNFEQETDSRGDLVIHLRAKQQEA